VLLLPHHRAYGSVSGIRPRDRKTDVGARRRRAVHVAGPGVPPGAASIFMADRHARSGVSPLRRSFITECMDAVKGFILGGIRCCTRAIG